MNNNKVCPSCGAEPWNFAEGENPKVEGSSKNSSEPRVQPKFCEDCGDKLIPRSELAKDIWKDPYVREALKERQAWDIAVLRCPECHQLGYYNEGRSFSCRFCDLSFLVVSPEEVDPEDQSREHIATVSTEDVIQLDDTVTECTDGYHNFTP